MTAGESASGVRLFVFELETIRGNRVASNNKPTVKDPRVVSCHGLNQKLRPLFQRLNEQICSWRRKSGFSPSITP